MRNRRVMLVACVLLLAATGVRAQAETGIGRRRTVRVPRPVQGPANFIDVAIFARMTEAGIRWAPRSTDAELLRRVSLDLTGQIPTAARARAFFASSDPRKREKLIDELIASDGFVDRWSLWLGDLAQNVEYANMSYVGPKGRNDFYAWMREVLARNDGYDVIVRQMLASGVVTPDARPSMYLARRHVIGPNQDTWDNLAAASGEHFLGLPMNCISCHDGRGHLELVNSALATRTRLDFWKVAAFFSRTRIAGGTFAVGVFDEPDGNYALGTTSGNKSPRHHPTLEGVDPEFLTGETPAEGERWRDAYARFVVADPRFAKVAVNRDLSVLACLSVGNVVGELDAVLRAALPAADARGVAARRDSPQHAHRRITVRERQSAGVERDASPGYAAGRALPRVPRRLRPRQSRRGAAQR